MLENFGRLDPPWSEVGRLKRGLVDLPVAGGPDALRDIEFEPGLDDDGNARAIGGDALTVLSTWNRDGVWEVESVVPYGSSSSRIHPLATGAALLRCTPEGAAAHDARYGTGADIERPGSRCSPLAGSAVSGPLCVFRGRRRGVGETDAARLWLGHSSRAALCDQARATRFVNSPVDHCP